MTHFEHFDIRQWVDFSRGVDAGVDRAVMARHLSGCAKCGRIVHQLTDVAAIARREADYEPPVSALRIAKAIFPSRRQESLLARLVYDSFREPLPAGMRSQDRQTRHALYEAENYYVDLRVDYQAASDTATLVGQLADRTHPATPATDVRVLLKTRQEIIASAACNSFGEFHLDYRPAPALQIEVYLGSSGRRLDLPLSSLTAAKPDRQRKGKVKAKRPAGN